MLHRPHIVLGDRIRHVADEEVLDRVTIRQERRTILRVITHHRGLIVLLPTGVKLRVIAHQIAITVLSHTKGLKYQKRAFTHQDSCICPPSNVYLPTRLLKYALIYRYLDRVFGPLTQESNYI